MLTAQKLAILAAIDAANGRTPLDLVAAVPSPAPAAPALEQLDLAELVEQLDDMKEDDAHARVRQLAKQGHRPALEAIASYFRGPLAQRAFRALERLPEAFTPPVVSTPSATTEPPPATPELELDEASLVDALDELKPADAHNRVRQWARQGNRRALELVAKNYSDELGDRARRALGKFATPEA